MKKGLENAYLKLIAAYEEKIAAFNKIVAKEHLKATGPDQKIENLKEQIRIEKEKDE